MDNRRLILTLAFMFSLVMLWEGWQKQHQPPAPVAQTAASATANESPVPVPSASSTDKGAPSVPGGAASDGLKGALYTVTTDTIVAKISAEGGNIAYLDLRKHKDKVDHSKNFVLFDNGGEHIYEAQSGLMGQGLPDHHTQFSLPEQPLELPAGQDSLTVRLEAPVADGIQVTKLLTFHRDSYLIDVAYEIHNAGTRAVDSAHAYFQFVRDGEPAEQVGGFGVHTFYGPAVYTNAEKYQKMSFENISKGDAKYVKKADDGWLAMVQHYFVGAWLPEGSVEREFFTRKIGADLYSAGVILPVGAIAPGASETLKVRLYAGPQDQRKLEGIAPGLQLVVDYGWLTVIAAPLFWVLQWFHKLTGNWGWAIILVTVSIKALFFPLSAASYKSMAKMRKLGPRLQQLKQTYGDDKMRMQQEMMEIYRKEKINPLGGCLPMVVQIPVFIALYWVLLGSVEMRQAPWLGWIQDLSSKDPYYVLPIIMGISMLIQTKLNPTPPDPIQAKVMLAMPIVFTAMFLFFPSGLVLYWVVNNSLSIAQQWQITRMLEGGKKA